MTDQEIVCCDCNTPFVFTAAEQEFYAEKQFSAPKRCRACRQAKKDKGQGGAGGGSRPQRPGGGGGGRSSGGSREMFDVVCTSCGAETQVPFKPSGDRPVYCRDCFKSNR
jgi:CxxC-x17-CxxC domain-containing protein